MGENVLRAFGYVRRRATAIQDINATLEDLGLIAEPPVNSKMPFRKPRIRFSLSTTTGAVTPESIDGPDTSDSSSLDAPPQDADDDDSNLPEPAFRVSELTSANTAVECVSPNASIQSAYTTMLLHRYSQLVVANGAKPCNKASKVSCRSNRLRRR